ncbi:MAG: TIGR02266 family protein [Deltaproteobacteria bacterium]|nr:TIGR02266 family protein [Deltaproteobacteria bacterium]
MTEDDDHDPTGDEGPGGGGPENRRAHERVDTVLSVDYASGDTFLFSYITNISVMGIFIQTLNPMMPGTRLKLRFAPPPEADAAGPDAIELEGEVVWINPFRPGGDNPNPGMGVRFSSLTAAQRERLVELVRTIAYLREDRDPQAN